jgi:hypothetical protein
LSSSSRLLRWRHLGGRGDISRSRESLQAVAQFVTCSIQPVTPAQSARRLECTAAISGRLASCDGMFSLESPRLRPDTRSRSWLSAIRGGQSWQFRS